ncbi:MAG: LysM domain-containing protein, partial [Anaerolineae bacterium]
MTNPETAPRGEKEPSRGLLRPLTWITLMVWRACTDWRSRRPMLIRVTAHLSIIVVALVALLLGGIEPAGRVFGAAGPQSIYSSQEQTPPPRRQGGWRPTPVPVLSRQALPHTTIPERPRTSVITYTVLPGDTVFGIAQHFGLTPHTIYWANSEVLHDNPHMLWPDMVLNILPVDGVYHPVAEGETVASIAEDHNVAPEVLYNEWNNLTEEQPLQAGMNLVIPGGTREFLVWQLPRYSDLRGSAAVGSGVCALPSVGLRGNGWFVWPTAARRISGWTFRDPRNPPHAGIDIGLGTGDPVYAADNG